MTADPAELAERLNRGLDAHIDRLGIGLRDDLMDAVSLIKEMVAAERFTTYKQADRELVAGEYAFVTTTEFFDDALDPVELVREEWRLVARTAVTHHPSPCYCVACNPEDG